MWERWNPSRSAIDEQLAASVQVAVVEFTNNDVTSVSQRSTEIRREYAFGTLTPGFALRPV